MNALQQSPEVFKSRVKEPHTLIPGDVRARMFGWSNSKKLSMTKLGFLNSIESYCKNYGDFAEDKLFIDASTLYSVHIDFTEELLELAKKNNLQVRFIILYRDPFERAVSHYRFSVSRGEEPRSFEQALEDEMNGLHRDWILGGYIQGSLISPVRNKIIHVFGEQALLEINLAETALFSKENLSVICQHLQLKPFQLDESQIYENKTYLSNNGLIQKLRVVAKNLRNINPAFFEAKPFRIVFNFFITQMAKLTKEQETDLQFAREKYEENLIITRDKMGLNK